MVRRDEKVWKMKESLLSWKRFFKKNVATVTTAYCSDHPKLWAAILVTEWNLANIYCKLLRVWILDNHDLILSVSTLSGSKYQGMK